MNLKKAIEAVTSRYKLRHQPSVLKWCYHKSEKVLLIVDIDYHDGWSPKDISGDQDRQQVARSLADRLAWARAANLPVIFVMLDSPSSDLCNKHRSQLLDVGNKCIGCGVYKNKLADFLGHRHGLALEPIFVKCTSDAFENKALAEYLHLMGARELLLAGCNTFACVVATAKGAIASGFNVTLLEDAVYPIFNDIAPKELWLQRVCNSVENSKQNAVFVAVTAAY